VAYHPRAAGQSKISGSVTGTLRAAWGMTRMIAKLWWRKVRADGAGGPGRSKFK
jgi:hypothetical protein